MRKHSRRPSIEMAASAAYFSKTVLLAPTLWWDGRRKSSKPYGPFIMHRYSTKGKMVIMQTSTHMLRPYFQSLRRELSLSKPPLNQLGAKFWQFGLPLKFFGIFWPTPFPKTFKSYAACQLSRACPVEQTEPPRLYRRQLMTSRSRPGVTTRDVIDDVISGQNGWAFTFVIK